MDTLYVTGGTPLRGRVRVGGAKNAALPLLAAALLPAGRTTLRRVPALTDTDRLCEVLLGLGALVIRNGGAVSVDPAGVSARSEVNAELAGGMRGALCLLGPLLAKTGRVALPAVGGCDLGPRPIDRHLAALAAMGAGVERVGSRRAGGGVVLTAAARLRGAEVNLAAPAPGGTTAVPTVTGTTNVLCAAATADGVTLVRGAAREPEVVAVGRYLNACGARITGLGTGTLHVAGVRRLAAPPAGAPACRVPPDRIEAATWLCAAAATRGRVVIDGIGLEPFAAVADLLRAAGVSVRACGSGRSPRVCVSAAGPVGSFEAAAGAYPAVPTDALPALAAVALTAAGTSLLTDGVFPARVAHLPRLARFGGSVGRAGETAILTGEPLRGARADCPDLRAAAAALVAALAADGSTELIGAGVLDRGYEGLLGKLRGLGATVATGRERFAGLLADAPAAGDPAGGPGPPRWRPPTGGRILAAFRPDAPTGTPKGPRCPALSADAA